MAILNVKVDSIGDSGQVPKFIYINTNDTTSGVEAAGYLNSLISQGFALSESDMALVATRPSPSSSSIQCGLYDLERSVEGNWSLVATGGGGSGVSGAVNIGGGPNGVFASQVGSILQFKSLFGGPGIILSPDSTDITISAAISAGDNIGTDANRIFAGVSGTTMQFRSLVAGPGISMLEGSGDITIAASGDTVNAAANIGVGAGVFAGQSGSELQFKSLIAGSGISFIDAVDHITISASAGTWDPDANWTTTGDWENTGDWHFSGGLTADITLGDMRIDNGGGNVIVRSFLPGGQAIFLGDTVRLTGSTFLQAQLSPTHGLTLNASDGSTTLASSGLMSFNSVSDIVGSAPNGGFLWDCFQLFNVQAQDFLATLVNSFIVNTGTLGFITLQSLDGDITLYSQGTDASVDLVSDNDITFTAQTNVVAVSQVLTAMLSAGNTNISGDTGINIGSSTGDVSVTCANGTVSLGSSIGKVKIPTLTAGTAAHIVYRDITTGDLSSAPQGFFAEDITNPGTIIFQPNHAYYVKSAGVVFNFAGTAAQGDTYKILGYSGGTWTVALQTGENLRLGSTAATTSVGTMVATTNFDCVTIECAVTDTGYAVTSVVGTPNLT